MAVTDLAPEGQVWICGACAKTSRSKGGYDARGNSVADGWWDESCMLNAVLCYEASIKRRENGRIYYADPVGDGSDRTK